MTSDLYGTFGSTPRVESSGVSGAGINVRADSSAFGGQVAKAEVGAGNEVSNIANHFTQMATEAKVKDDYANKYVPAATQLRSQYDSLRGQDKVAGYDGYIAGLQELNKQYTETQPGLIGRDMMANLVNQHVSGEVQGAQRELVQSQKEFADKSTFDMLNANNSLAAANYNNPELVDSVIKQNDNHILIQHVDVGHDPNDLGSASFISDAQAANKAQMSTAMINTAVGYGDVSSANEIRAKYSSSIPGYQKLSIDNLLHTANIQQTSIASVKALTSGKPLPEAYGAPATRVQALVADTAKSNSVDANNALTVLRIESANGQNLGARGTLGQDKESAGKSQEEQAKALCDNLKTANARAAEVLGRQPEHWEGYAVYQQGVGGGAALLKATKDEPNTLAIDVLTPLYKNPKDALAALTGNGGNITMTASDFTDHIKQVYEDNAKRSNCNFGDSVTPGDALLAPHQTPGVTVQPASTPTQALMNFDKKTPELLAKINAIPNDEVREGVMRQYNQERKKYSDSATAYKTVLLNQATQLAADPNFTSVDQVPPELQSALLQDHPETLDYMEKRAEHNLELKSGMNTKDMREYGANFYNLFNAIHAPSDDASRVTSLKELQKYVGKSDGLTISGYDRLSKELQEKGTPDGEAEGMMKKQFFANAKQQISGKDEALGITDPKGEENYLRFMAQALPAYEQGKSDGKSATALLNPDSPDYIGKSITSFKRTTAEMLADMEIAEDKPIEDASTWRDTLHKFANATSLGLHSDQVTPDSLRQAVLSGKMTRAEGEAEALKRGYIRPTVSTTVPLAE